MSDYTSKKVTRKSVIEKAFIILDIVCQNPGIGTNEVRRIAGFSCDEYLREMEEVGILYKEIENFTDGAMCNHYYSHKFAAKS
ncbi:hypothetical protein CAL7716_085810 [Calothrix sp. PCC 7716]|nr:hypothetical protein CAL7716_085810 [Calothrix sp. PCC 7716]